MEKLNKKDKELPFCLLEQCPVRRRGCQWIVSRVGCWHPGRRREWLLLAQKAVWLWIAGLIREAGNAA